MDRRCIDRAMGPWAARQRGPVITFVEKSAGCLGFDQGIAALISGLDDFSRVLPTVIIPDGFWMLWIFWFMLLSLLC